MGETPPMSLLDIVLADSRPTAVSSSLTATSAAPGLPKGQLDDMNLLQDPLVDIT